MTNVCSYVLIKIIAIQEYILLEDSENPDEMVWTFFLIRPFKWR